MGMSSLRKTGSRDQPKAGETCYFCGRGILEEKRVTVDFRWGDRLVIIERSWPKSAMNAENATMLPRPCGRWSGLLRKSTRKGSLVFRSWHWNSQISY